MAASSTDDDIPMATPEKAPADTSDDGMLVASPASDTDDEDNTADDATSEQEKEAPPLMTGWCHKKGKLGFHARYYTLSADGKLYSARDDDQTTTRKYMLGLGESSTFEPARKTDLIVKGHNNEESEERPVSITLRFNDPEERDKWVEAFENFIHKKEEEETDAEVPLIDPKQAAVRIDCVLCAPLLSDMHGSSHSTCDCQPSRSSDQRVQMLPECLHYIMKSSMMVERGTDHERV